MFDSTTLAIHRINLQYPSREESTSCLDEIQDELDDIFWIRLPESFAVFSTCSILVVDSTVSLFICLFFHWTPLLNSCDKSIASSCLADVNIRTEM